ncbi:MAG: 30S ribosomal protein S12 methylthiotransferase RimO [Planctomycetota bacterium]
MHNKKVSFISLGCPKSLVDSERMLGLLVQNGVILCEDYQDSDAIIINTCGFIESAREESLETINQALKMKEKGIVKKVFVTGCMVDFCHDALFKKLKNVDGFLSVKGRDKIVDFLNVLWDGKRKEKYFRANNGEPCLYDRERLRLTPRHFAYVKISEGCSNPCSFCSIPKIRGAIKSKKEDEIISEIKELVEDGAREIILVAQDTTLYGWDIHKKSVLDELLIKISNIDKIKWIRLLYAHPAHITREIINVIVECKNIVKYIDMPIQHISDKILFAMNRKVGAKQIRDLIYYMRSVCPDIAIRTSVIVGFPGETEKDFNELCNFINEVKFDRLGAFIYSPEAHTPASRFLDQVEQKVKIERFEKIIELQEKIAFEKNKSLSGKKIECIIDKKTREGEFLYEGRTYMDAPDVDGVIYFKEPNLQPGDFVEAEVVNYKGYDLVGKVSQF